MVHLGISTTPCLPDAKVSESIDYGDLIDNEHDDVSTIEAEAEEEVRYGFPPREYYPIRIGEILNQTYHIVHKISHGGFSTVWLAEDLKRQRNVAVKVMVSDFYGEVEYQIQTALHQTVQDKSHLVLYEDVFLLSSPETNHYVFVFPFLGPSAGSIVGGQLPIPTRMHAAKQLLQTIETLHKSGFVHRDINSMNALWGSTLPENLSIADKYKILGRPLRKLIPYTPWKQGELVKSIDFPIPFCSEKIHLADFGTTMQIDNLVMLNDKVSNVIPPDDYCSPEQFHGATPHYSCDMWSYMCVFSTLYFGFPLFRNLNNVVAYLGPLPEYLKGKYLWPKSSKDEWYDQNTTATASLEKRIRFHKPELSSIERNLVLSVLSKGFCLEPKHRLTASQLLRDPDFNALINLHCG
ncbi:predicted protein [Uncinocarpus reesii 1704]|uniref:Protein kinase domain-containing protein n=1 Tax=Uncinocarpus reesii (strain UAMH 1704) TaxID=336963 RepID=C4JEW8_UNCRE|nr:uncharacterized protein UREG_00868 [Uncinocarpus reesii 1704]EEP76021.1 predicted protein [Uncinocarpus reesii 1704]